MSEPLVTVAALIYHRKNKKLLFVKRAFEPYVDCWQLPGGHLRMNENVANAVRREVKEETNLDLRPGFFRYYDEIILHKDWHAVVLVFDGEFIGEEIVNSEEVRELRWIGREGMKGLKFAFYHKEIAEDYFNYIEKKEKEK